MKRLAITLILTCVLTTSALAGDVPTAGATQSGGSTQTSSVAATVILTIISLIGR